MGRVVCLKHNIFLMPYISSHFWKKYTQHYFLKSYYFTTLPAARFILSFFVLPKEKKMEDPSYTDGINFQPSVLHMCRHSKSCLYSLSRPFKRLKLCSQTLSTSGSNWMNLKHTKE